MSKHTHGPWVFDEQGNISKGDSPDSMPLATTFFGYLDFGQYPRDANARLIAAAPELLEALMCFVDNEQFRLTERQRLDKARAAIAKATGEQA